MSVFNSKVMPAQVGFYRLDYHPPFEGNDEFISREAVIAWDISIPDNEETDIGDWPSGPICMTGKPAGNCTTWGIRAPHGTVTAIWGDHHSDETRWIESARAEVRTKSANKREAA